MPVILASGFLRKPIMTPKVGYLNRLQMSHYRPDGVHDALAVILQEKPPPAIDSELPLRGHAIGARCRILDKVAIGLSVRGRSIKLIRDVAGKDGKLPPVVIRFPRQRRIHSIISGLPYALVRRTDEPIVVQVGNIQIERATGQGHGVIAGKVECPVRRVG